MLALAHRHSQGGLGVPKSCEAARAYYDAAAARVAEEYEARALPSSTYTAGLYSYLADKDKVCLSHSQWCVCICVCRVLCVSVCVAYLPMRCAYHITVIAITITTTPIATVTHSSSFLS